jgi:hypothetical protein
VNTGADRSSRATALRCAGTAPSLPAHLSMGCAGELPASGPTQQDNSRRSRRTRPGPLVKGRESIASVGIQSHRHRERFRVSSGPITTHREPGPPVGPCEADMRPPTRRTGWPVDPDGRWLGAPEQYRMKRHRRCSGVEAPSRESLLVHVTPIVPTALENRS